MIDRDAVQPLPEVLESALQRLAEAVSRLQGANARREAATGGRPDAATELRVMDEDRTRLALELDAALARAERLREAQGAVLERIGRAETSVEAVMQALASDETLADLPIEEAS